jgi:hypothetical protein
MSKIKTLAILGVGYVLGAQAGRARYEQIKQQAMRVAEHPRTQAFAQQAREKVSTKLPESVTSKLGTTGWPGSSSTSSPSSGTSSTGTSSTGTTQEPSTIDLRDNVGAQPTSRPSNL